MKKSGIFLCVLLTFILSSDLKAQTYPLSNFVETIVPAPNSPERDKVCRSGYDFVVNIRNGKLKIRKYKEKNEDDEVQLIVDNGRIVGTDEGEWGGKLWFINEAHDTSLIKEGNIHFLFRYNHEIYSIEGLGHMGINEGSMYKLIFVDGAYKYQKIVDLGDEPQVMCIVNNDILVASFNNFYKIHDLKKEKIFPDLLADDLLPRSLVATDSKHIYMGVAGGYLQIDLIDNSYKFYRYNAGHE